MATTGSKVLSRMLDRLLAGLMSGPNMNCRPAKSRQRIDITQLIKLDDIPPEEILHGLLGEEKSAKVIACVKVPKKAASDAPVAAVDKAWTDQSALLSKLRLIADDARTYENDTGVHALSIGFPLLSLPPGTFAGAPRNSTKRILAPIAFIPVTLSLKGGATPSVEISCRGEGADRVVPNTALISWIEQQTGKPQKADPFEDEEGTDPWREITELVEHTAAAMRLDVPKLFQADDKPSDVPPTRSLRYPEEPDSVEAPETSVPLDPPDPALWNTSETGVVNEPVESTPPVTVPTEIIPVAREFKLLPATRVDDEADQPAILLSAVLGLFPTAHQGLVRDTRAMLAEPGPFAGPIQNFLTSGIDFDAPAHPTAPVPVKLASRPLSDERLAAAADPCQARAVALAREAAGLVIHGPPGTGKSQTITNIISDHLARGQRVLLVCDKRTALDVVADRLEHMGLRSLCAIVHDPQRDQRDLYRSIHEQLDELPEAKTYPTAANKLAKVDAELQQLHDELTTFQQSLMDPAPNHGPSFHELMGQWMAFRPTSDVRLDDASTAGITVDELEANQTSLSDLFKRAAGVGYSKNLWVKCAGVSLGDFLARPMAVVHTAMNRIAAAAEAADAAADPRIAPFAKEPSLQQQAHARSGLAEQLIELLPNVLAAGLAPWAAEKPGDLKQWRDRLDGVKPMLSTFSTHKVDPELAAFTKLPLAMADNARDQFALDQYLRVAKKWWGFFAFGTKSEATKVLKTYALPLTPENAQRLSNHLLAMKARATLSGFCDLLAGKEPGPSLVPDGEIEKVVQTAEQWFAVLDRLATDPALTGIGPALSKLFAACGFAEPTAPETQNSTTDFIDGLKLSTARAESITKLEESFTASTLFDENWLAGFSSALRQGKLAHETASALIDQLDTLEGVLRIRTAVANVPQKLRPSVDQLLSQLVSADDALAAVHQKVLSAEIARRLKDNPTLQSIDSHRIESGFDRFRELDQQKKKLVRDVIAHQWISKQKDRLLATTGKRLNSVGADLRRRLTSRGQRAMRLRQVIAIGEKTEGGDPLFDLCPVWMASPETVAQIFPRKPVFDVVVFDEASQCRLEEALPVLTRGQRVVIAGDPNQLPPTRFFESGLVQSEDEEPETDQELFETQQGEVEDLLAAALNLAIQQCYLDVHYRSRNSDLIEFSNRNFYASRLQAIPGHPANRSKFSPLTLYRVDGTYNKRQNEAEADRVVQIVKDLLKRAKPPSIGIACLNLPQRDLIVEKLDDLAGEDADFGKRLAAARIRKGQGSFEGLFVKNLENVQGDERDDIIISTTYGPDPKGKFFRRFGPLGMAGGGRRLNVLVTRARNEVHLVTSIPIEAYRSLPAVPQGQTATGAWLLFAYLKYAEELGMVYQNANVERPTSNLELRSEQAPAVKVLPSSTPSAFAEGLAASLAERSKVGSDVHWGNEGFCVDLAMHHPARPGDVTIGVLCDGCRYAAADDPLEWDIFRTGILADQGWTLRRIWTPHFFRDPEGNAEGIVNAASEFVAKEKPPAGQSASADSN